MATREELQQEYIHLRNAQMKRGTCARTRKIYFDHLLDSDGLAEMKSDEELVKAIEKLKRQAK